jgi:Ca2+-binding EF-hand superfamily protein
VKRNINSFIKRQRIELKMFFKDWDKRKRNRVSAKQFRQVLATIKFNMTDYESECITNMYLTKDGQDVNYQLFIQDCLGEQILD